MLTVYRSNRAEWLAKLLAEQLRLSPPKPFEKLDIIVNTWATSRWLGEQIADVNDISALVPFPFPGEKLRQITREILGLDAHTKDPWQANRLVWHLLEVLPEFLNTSQGNFLKKWRQQHNSKIGYLCKEDWLLA